MTFTPGDLKDVANLVARKLEVYMNKERRETRFQPAGCFRTTKKMQKYDLLHRVMETSDLEQIPAPPSKSPQRKSLRRKSPDGKIKMAHKSRKQDPSKERREIKDKKFHLSQNGRDKQRPQSDSDRRGEMDKKKDKDGVVLKRETWVRVVDDDESFSSQSLPDTKLSISPKLKKTSLSVVAKKEAVRLSEYASNVFDGHDLDKLQVIHRYRPNSSDIPHITENGKVQNYTCHVGSALHTKKYVDYYIKEGLQTGRKEYSKRLQELKQGTPSHSEKGSEKGSVQSVKTAASASTTRSEDYRDTRRERTRGTLPPITSSDLVSPRSMQSLDSSMSSRYSSSSFNSELTSTYKIVSTSLSQAPLHQPHPPVQPLRHTMQEPLSIQTLMTNARPASARLAERRYVPVVRNAFLIDAEDKEMYSPRSLKLDRASSTTDLLPRFDNYTQTPRDSATQTPRRHREQITTEDTSTITSDTFVDQETQTPRSSRHGLKKKKRRKYENLELTLQSSDATESVDSEMDYGDRRFMKRNRHTLVSSTSDSFRSTSTQDMKTKVCQTSFSVDSEESFPSFRRRNRNLSETITLKSVDEDNPASSLPNSTIHLFKDDNVSDSVFDSEEQNGRYIGSAIASENRADLGSSEEYVAYDRAGEGDKTPDMKETGQHGPSDTEKQLEDCPQTLGNESNEDSFWETRGVKDSPQAAGSGSFGDDNICSEGQNDPEDLTSAQYTSQHESAQTKESESKDVDNQEAVAISEVTVSPENVTVEEPASINTVIEVMKTDPEVADAGEDTKNLSDSFDVCRGAVELPSFEEDPRGDRIFSDIEGTMEEYRGNFLNLSETVGSDSSSRYKKFPSDYMYVPEDRGSDGDTLVDSDSDPEVYTKSEKIFSREETDEQLEMDEELCRGAAPVKRKNSESSSYCSATRAQGEINPTYQEVTVSRANSVSSQATLSSVRGSGVGAWKKDPSGKTASDQSEKLDLTQDLLNDEDFLEVAEDYEFDVVKGPNVVAANVDPITDESTSPCSRGSGDKVLSPASEMPSRGEEEFLNLETSKDEVKCEVGESPVDTEDRPVSCNLSTGTGDVKMISFSEFHASTPVPADAEIHEADVEVEDDGKKMKEDKLETADSESRGNVDKTQLELTMSSRGGDESVVEPFNTTKDDNNQMEETHDNSEKDVKYEPDDDREEFDTVVSEGTAPETKHETTAEADVPRPDSSCSTSRGFAVNESSLQGSSQAASSRGQPNNETVQATVEGDGEDVVAVNKNETVFVTNDNFSGKRKLLQKSSVPTECSAEERGDAGLFLGEKVVTKKDEKCDEDCDFKDNIKSKLPYEETSVNLPSDDEVFNSEPTVSKPISLIPVSACCPDRSPPRPISACHVMMVPPLQMDSAGLKEDTVITDVLHTEEENSGDEICQIQASDHKGLISHDESRGQFDTTLSSEVLLCEKEEQATGNLEEPRVTEDDQILQSNSVRPSSTKNETVSNSINIILDVGAPIKSTTLKDNPRRPVSAHGLQNNPAPSARQRPVSAHLRQMPDMIMGGSSGQQCGIVTGSVTVADDDVSKGNDGINESGPVLLDESRGQIDVQVETPCQQDPADKENTFEENEPKTSETELPEKMEQAVLEMSTLKMEQTNHQDISSSVLTPVNTCDDGIEKDQTTELSTDALERKAQQEQDVTDLDMLTDHPVRPGSSLSVDRGEGTDTPRPVLSPPRKKLERSDSVCSRGSEIDNSGKICSKEMEQKLESVDQGAASAVTDSSESKPDVKSHPSEISSPVADEIHTIPGNIIHDGQGDVACDIREVIQEQESWKSECQDIMKGEEPVYVSSHRGSITHRDAVLTKAVLTSVLSPSPPIDNEESCMPIACRDTQTHNINPDESQQEKNVEFQRVDVMTNLKTDGLGLPDDKSDEKPAPNALIPKDSLNFFSFDDPDGSKVGHSFTLSEESTTLQTSTDTVMNDSTESSTTCNTTNTTDILEEHYTRTDQLIPANVSQDSLGMRYAVLASNSQTHTAQDIVKEKVDPEISDKVDKAPATGTKSSNPVSHEDSLGCEEDEDDSGEDGTSPVGILRPLSVLGMPQKDLSNKRLSLESRGSSEFITETDEVLIVSSRGDEILPESNLGVLPTIDNLPESQTYINGYLRVKPTVVEHRGDEEEESYCSLAAPSVHPEETQDDHTTQKVQGDIKVISPPSCTHPSPLESKLADYLGNVDMNSLIAVVDESPVDVDYTKCGKSRETSYHLVLNEEHCEPDSGSLGDAKNRDRLNKTPDDSDRSRSDAKSLEDKSELPVVKNIPTVSLDPKLQEMNMTYEKASSLKEKPIGNRKAVTFADEPLLQEDICTLNLSTGEISNVAETQGSKEERLTNNASIKSEVMMPEVLHQKGSENHEDLKPQKSDHEETSLSEGTLQPNINHVTETVERPVSEQVEASSGLSDDEPEAKAEALSGRSEKVDEPVPTSEINLVQGQTVIPDAEAPRGLSEKVNELEAKEEAPSGLSEKVDEPVPTSETNLMQGHCRQSTSLHGQTVITVAEAPRGLSEKVKEPEAKAEAPSGMSEKVDEPVPTSETNLIQAQTVIPDAEAPSGLYEKVDESVPTSEKNLIQGQTVIPDAEAPGEVLERNGEPVPTSETNLKQGDHRQSTSLQGQTIITVAEAPSSVLEKVKDPEDKTATNPNGGNHNLLTSVPGTTILTVAEADQVSGAAVIVQSSNEAVDGQVEQTSGHRVIAVSEHDGLLDKASHEHVTQGEKQNRMNPPRIEEQREEVESEQLLRDTENNHASEINYQLSDEASALKPVTVSDGVSGVLESDASSLNGESASGTLQTITSKPSGMSVSANMAESDGQSVSESKRGQHSDQMSGHRIILVSESLPSPVAKAKVIERRPGGSRVILVSEKSEV